MSNSALARVERGLRVAAYGTRWRRAAITAAIGLLLATAAKVPPAWAQQGAPPDANALDARALAAEKIRIGVEHRRAGREREALDAFREAHALNASPRTLGQMGLAAKSLRLYVEAERYLDGALAAAEDPWVQQNRAALELARALVVKHLASLNVVSNVDGAELLVDGTRVATLPLTGAVRIPAGAARLEVRAPGHASSIRDVTLPAEQTLGVRVDLMPLEPPASPPERARRRKPVRQHEGFEGTRSSRVPWIIASAALGTAGVGFGTYFGIKTLSEKEARDRACGGADSVVCASDEGLEHDSAARSAASWSTVGFVVGAAGLGTALVLLLLEPSSKRQTSEPRRRASVGSFVHTW